MYCRMFGSIPGAKTTFHGGSLVQAVEGRERASPPLPSRPPPVPSPDPVGEWMSYSTSVCLSLQKVLERGESSGSRIRKSRALGRADVALVLPDIPSSPCVGGAASPAGRGHSMRSPPRGRGTWIQRSLRFSAGGQTVSLQPALLASSATASTKHVLFFTLRTSPGRVFRTQTDTGARAASRVRGHPAPTHRHTYTSRGGWVLGVMIQGATRNTTLSVKMGDSEKSCRLRPEGKQTGLGAQRLAWSRTTVDSSKLLAP